MSKETVFDWLRKHQNKLVFTLLVTVVSGYGKYVYGDIDGRINETKKQLNQSNSDSKLDHDALIRIQAEVEAIHETVDRIERRIR